MDYTIELSPAAERQLRAITRSVQSRLIEHMLNLRLDPRPDGVKKLDDQTYRIRVGDYRIIYDITDQTLTILVLKIGHRRDIYRRRH